MYPTQLSVVYVYSHNTMFRFRSLTLAIATTKQNLCFIIFLHSRRYRVMILLIATMTLNFLLRMICLPFMWTRQILLFPKSNNQLREINIKIRSDEADEEDECHHHNIFGCWWWRPPTKTIKEQKCFIATIFRWLTATALSYMIFRL